MQRALLLPTGSILTLLRSQAVLCLIGGCRDLQEALDAIALACSPQAQARRGALARGQQEQGSS